MDLEVGTSIFFRALEVSRCKIDMFKLGLGLLYRIARIEAAGLASLWSSCFIRSEARKWFLSSASSSMSTEYMTVLSLLSSMFGVHSPL